MSETFELELDAMAHGGSALGRHNKQTIFVPYTIPGERIVARITQDRGRIAFAEGVKLLDASNDRVFPICPHFGPHKCGRCQWQHIDYAAQLLLKQDVLSDQLSRVGKFDDDVIEATLKPLIASPVQWGYNYSMTLFVSDEGKLGFTDAENKGVFPIDVCEILHPDLLALYEQLDLDVTGIHRVTFAMGSDQAHMIILHLDDEEDVPELHADMPASVNILLPDNEPVNLIGDSHVRYHIGGKDFRVTAGSTFRSNISQIENLVQTVMDALQPHDKMALLDLYAGVGLFSAFAAPHVSLVTLVESYPPAATDADENLAAFENVDIIEGTVEEVLETLEETYDAVILDPPSSGLSIEVLDALRELQIPRLIYVSSDPATLARDGQRLTTQGYQLENIQPLDLHPQTYFIDAVAVFRL